MARSSACACATPTEEAPLGTAGSVRNAMAELDETFLVISGDVLTDVDLSGIVEQHNARGAFASIALKRVENPVDFGIVITREDGQIERFLEKPTWGEVFSDTINTGIYVLDPGVFEFIPEGEVVDFSNDVFPAVLDRGLSLLGTVVDGYWEDVGTLESYRTAHEDLLDGQIDIEVPGFQLREGVWIGEGVDVSPDAIIHGPVLVGDNSRVEAGAVLAPYTVLGADVVVKADAHLERTVVHDHGYIGHSARLRGAVIGRANDIREHAHIEEGVVIGDECFVGARAIISPGVKIYPFKTVEAGALVTSSIVWESKGARTLFGRRGVRGLANVDITSEVAVRLAMAYGTALEEGLGRVYEPRHEPCRACAQAGDHRRPQPGRRPRDGPRAVDGARHPVPGAQRAGAGRDLGAAGTRRSRQRGDPLLRRHRRRHRRGRPAQVGAPAVPRRLPPGVRGRHRRHHVPAARVGVLHRRARIERRWRAAPATLVQGGARLLVRRGVGRDAPRARQDRGVGARGQPVRGDGGRHHRRPRDPREDHGRSRAHFGIRPRARIRSRR